MHSDHPYFPQKPMLPFSDQVGCYMQNAHVPSVFNGKPFMPPINGVDINPSDACPRNFIIFDQSNNRSQIIFHPEINSKFLYPGFGIDASLFQDKVDKTVVNDEGKIASPLKEDSADIDALLSSEYEENEESDDEMVSTARTNAIYECNSPDSCSNYESLSSKSRSLFKKSSFGNIQCNDKKRKKMRKMVKALKGIVPNANRMSTVAVLDEAVRYLKSLRVEVQKMGVGNSKH